jgi:hypothetical protein
MAGVVGRRAGEAREGEVSGVRGCCDCESCCCDGHKTVVMGYESRCASESDLHDELGPKHQDRILMFGWRGRLPASAESGSIWELGLR